MDTESVQVLPIRGRKPPMTTLFGNLTEKSGKRRLFWSDASCRWANCLTMGESGLSRWALLSANF